MRTIERVLIYFIYVFLITYLIFGLKFGLYLTIISTLLIQIFRLINYNRLKKEIKEYDLVYFPMRKEYLLSVIYLIAFLGLIVGVPLVMKYCFLIKIRPIESSELLIISIIVLFFTFSNLFSSDLTGKYIIGLNGLVSGLRYSDCIYWSEIDNLVFDDEKAIILVQRRHKTLLKMKIDKDYYCNNINFIKEKMDERILKPNT